MEIDIVDFLRYTLVGGQGVGRTLATILFCLLIGVVGGAVLAFLTPIYTVALLIALAGGVIMLRDTQWGLFAVIGVICLLPFAAVPLNVGFEPTFLDLTLLALFFVWISRIATRKQGPFIASPLALPILAFLIIIIASFIAGLAHASVSMTLLRRFAELVLGIVVLFAVINCVRTSVQLREIVIVLMLTGFAASLIGIGLYFLPSALSVRLLSLLRYVRYPAGPDVLRYIEDNPELPLRAISTSQDPNVLGGLLVLVTGLTVPQLFTQNPLLPRKLILAMVASMIACLVLTFSRGAMAGLAVGLGVVSLLRYRRLVLILTGGAVLFLLLPQTQSYIQHFLEGVRGQDLATQMRFGEYRDAFTLILRHPWLGVGFAGTPEINLYLGVSSVYLLMAEEMGLIGLALFFLIMSVLFHHVRQALKRLKHDPELEAILWGLTAALLGAMVTGTLDHYFFNLDFPHAITIFWIYVGLSMAIWRLAQVGAQEATPLEPTLRG